MRPGIYQRVPSLDKRRGKEILENEMKRYIVRYKADNGNQRIFWRGENKKEALKEGNILVERDVRIDVYDMKRVEQIAQKPRKTQDSRKRYGYVHWVNKKVK